MDESCFSMDSENPSMKEFNITSAATPIAIPAIDNEDTVLTKPELDLLNICRQAIRKTRGSFTVSSASNEEKG